MKDATATLLKHYNRYISMSKSASLVAEMHEKEARDFKLILDLLSHHADDIMQCPICDCYFIKTHTKLVCSDKCRDKKHRQKK